MLYILLEGRSGQQAPGLPSGNVQAASGVARTRSYQTAQSLIGRHFDSNPPIERQLFPGEASEKSLEGMNPHTPPSIGVRGVDNGAFLR